MSQVMCAHCATNNIPGYMEPTGLSQVIQLGFPPVRVRLIEVRCRFCGHLALEHEYMGSEQTEDTTTTAELTVEADDAEAVRISGATVSIPVELLRGGGGVTVTTTYNVTITATPAQTPEAPTEPPATKATRYLGGSR